MDHRAVIFSDRTYTGPIHAETKHQEALKNKLAEVTIPASKLTHANIVGYGTSKKVEAPKPISDDDEIELEFEGDNIRKLEIPGVTPNPKKRTFDSFLQRHGTQKNIAEEIQKRRKLN